MKSITNTINESRYGSAYKTVIHFDNAASAFLFKFELSGQISDGKYENYRPMNHWEWVSNVECVVDGEEGYEGPFHRIKYNLNEWPGYIKKADADQNGDDRRWGWARRVLDYARIADSLSKDEVDKVLSAGKYESGVRYVAEIWGDAVRENPGVKFEELDIPDYMKTYVDKASWLCDKAHFEKFKSKEYTLRSLRGDLQSMETSVNTPL